MIPYSKQYIDEDDIKAVSEALKSDFLTTGSRVKEFERRLAEYCGARFVVVVSSGTAALHAACYAAGISKGDEVITTPITFFATVASIMFRGATPIFADIRPDTLNIDVGEVESHITPRTKAIIPVDFAGHPVELEGIKELAKQYNLIVIEDACHALGAEYKGKKVGGLSDMTVFSFHPVKSITTGEGGAILTNNYDYYAKLCQFRNHNIIKNSQHWKYEIRDIGYNYRLSDIHCALGISQLNKLDKFINARRGIAKIYNEVFKDLDEIILPAELPDVKSSYHLYVIQLKTLNRDKVIQELLNNNIQAQVHYIPCHLQPVMKKYYQYGNYPIAENYHKRCLSLPLYPSMDVSDIQWVIETVRKVIK